MAFLPGGGTVELGLPFDTTNKSPCAVVPPATGLINSSGALTNLNCNGYFSYFRNQRIHTSTPMERVSLRSNYFQRVELLGSFTYSSAAMNTPLDESFNGLETRTTTRAYTNTGTGSARQISNVLDLEGTVHVTKHIRIIDKFYFWAFRIPQDGNFTEIDSICTAACNLLTPLSATAPAGTNTLTQSSFNQSWITNQTQVAWDISKKVGANLGFRYSDQVFKHFNDFLPGDEDYFAIHGYTELFGIWARPIHGLRLNFNQEYTSFDHVIVRISPRKQSQYRFQAGYTRAPGQCSAARSIFSSSRMATHPLITRDTTETTDLLPHSHPTSASPSIWHTTTTTSSRMP
jgi:hypothetical protein